MILGGRAVARSDPSDGYYLRDHSQLTLVSKATHTYCAIHGAMYEPSLYLNLFGLGCMLLSGHVRITSVKNNMEPQKSA